MKKRRGEKEKTIVYDEKETFVSGKWGCLEKNYSQTKYYTYILDACINFYSENSLIKRLLNVHHFETKGPKI